MVVNVERGGAAEPIGSEVSQGQAPAGVLGKDRPGYPKTVRIGIRPQPDAAAQKTPLLVVAGDEALLHFSAIESFIKTLTLKRWQLVHEMQGAGPMSLRAAARRVARDVKGVHADVHALFGAGLLVRNADGRIECPFDHIHVEFDVRTEDAGATTDGSRSIV